MSNLKDKLLKKGSDLKDKSKLMMSSFSDSIDLDMQKENEMEYKVLDNEFRDIYERGNEKDDNPAFFVNSITYSLTSLYLFLVFILPPLFVSIFNEKARGHFFKIFYVFYLYGFSAIFRTILLGAIGFGIYLMCKVFINRYWESQHMDRSKEMLEQFKDDSRLQQPEELAENYWVFPDSGMHSKGLDVTAILGHIQLTDNGLDDILVPKLSDGKHDVDEDGNVLNRNLIAYDDNGDIIREKKSMIDSEYGDRLFDSSFIPRPIGRNAAYIKHVLRRRYDPSKLLYNPMERYGKDKFRYLSDFINQDWYMPDYEVQRPAGAYIVDTEPNNTMV